LVAVYVHKEITNGIDSALIESAERLLDLAAHEVAEIRAHDGANAPTTILATTVETHTEGKGLHYPLVYQVVDEQQRILLRTSGAPEQPLAKDLAPGFAQTAQWRVYTLRHPDEPLYIHIADSLAYRQRAVLTTMLWLLMPLFGLLPLLVWVVRNLVQRELSPVAQVAQQIQARSGNNLNPIEGETLPQELQIIASSANQLLLRLSEALDVERALAASAAHELRTPLAAARLRLRSALDAQPDGSVRLELEQALRALDHLVRSTEKLLQFSRAGSAAALAREPVDLVKLAADVAQEFWAQPDMLQRLRLSIPEDTDAPVRALGDLDTLAIALRNLLQNAMRHGAGSVVEVQVLFPACIVVRDHGPGVSPDQLDSIKRLFVRKSAQPGFGLGLSIVAMIAERHGGKLELKSPLPDSSEGFQASLWLQPA
jgi:two-component system OmpR family sensor kinase